MAIDSVNAFSVTAYYAAFLGLLLVVLSVRIIRLRRRYKVGMGHDGQPELLRATRVHANFIEYVPLALFLLYLLEQQAVPTMLIHVMGSILLLGRLSHAYGVSQIDENYCFRVAGMAMTFTVIVTVSLSIFIMPYLL